MRTLLFFWSGAHRCKLGTKTAAVGSTANRGCTRWNWFLLKKQVEEKIGAIWSDGKHDLWKAKCFQEGASDSAVCVFFLCVRRMRVESNKKAIKCWVTPDRSCYFQLSQKAFWLFCSRLRAAFHFGNVSAWLKGILFPVSRVGLIPSLPVHRLYPLWLRFWTLQVFLTGPLLWIKAPFW